MWGGRGRGWPIYKLSISYKQLRHIENSIVLYKKEGSNGQYCASAHSAVKCPAVPYADAQYWGRYGRCIVKGYRKWQRGTSDHVSGISLEEQTMRLVRTCKNKLQAGGRHGMPRPSSPRGRWSAFRHCADSNVAAASHGQHVPTPTAAAAWCANMAVSKEAGDLHLWPWKWCSSHVWRGLPLC